MCFYMKIYIVSITLNMLCSSIEYLTLMLLTNDFFPIISVFKISKAITISFSLTWILCPQTRKGNNLVETST